MKNEDDFTEVEMVEDGSELVKSSLSSVVRKSDDVFEVRKELIEKHSGFLYEKVKGRREDADQILSVVIDEIIKETDNLLGNSLIFTQEGKLHDASTVSVKRSEILETLTRVLQKKRDLFSNSGVVDYNSPVFKVFQMVCFEKLTSVLDSLNMDNEQKKIIVSKWVESMSDWQKDVKMRMDNVTNK